MAKKRKTTPAQEYLSMKLVLFVQEVMVMFDYHYITSSLQSF